MSKHTPGPWQVSESYINTPTYDLRERIVGEHKVPTLLVSTDGQANTGSGICHVLNTDLANARLIAAAPDLLAACKEALKEIEAFRAYWTGPTMGLKYGVGPREDQIKAAIAKAEGIL